MKINTQNKSNLNLFSNMFKNKLELKKDTIAKYQKPSNNWKISTK